MNITTANDQKLLLAVSFGTSFADTREKTIGAIERRIAERFPDCTIQRCFTSRMIRKKLVERDGLIIDSPEQAMQNAQEKGIRQLIVQPLYLMHGFEHRRLMETIREAASSFDKLKVGKPLLSDDADFCTMADAIRRNLPAPEPDTAVVLMGHGNEKKKKPIPADVKAERISEILPVIKERGFRKVILAPFMVVAGDHARNDLAGEDEDSWKSIFTRSGFQVETVVRGIGEWEEVQDLFAAHAAQCMEET